MPNVSPNRDASRPQMDRAYGWIIVCASFWVSFINDGSIFSFGPYLQPMTADLHVSHERVALLSSLQYGFYQISAPMISILINLLGFRKVAFIGGWISCLGYLLASFTSNYYLTLLTFSFMVGIGSGMIYATGLLIVSFHFAKYRPLANAIVMCGSSLGAFCLSLILQSLLNSWDRVSTLRFQSALCVITTVGSLTFSMPGESAASEPFAMSLTEDSDAMKRNLQTASLETSRMLNDNNAPDSNRKKSCCSLVCKYLQIHCKQTCDVSLLQSPIFICLCLSYFIMFLGHLTPYVFVVERSIANGIPINQAKWLLPMISVGTLMGRFVAALTTFCPMVNLIYITSFLVFMAGLFSVVSSFVLTGDFAFQGAYAVGWGLLAATAGTLRTGMFIECMGLERLTTVWGITRMFMGLSGLFGAPFAAAIRRATGKYAYSFVYSGVCFMTFSCVLMVIPVVLQERVEKSVEFGI